MEAIKLCRLDTPIIFIKALINWSRIVVIVCAAKTFFFFQAEDGIRDLTVTWSSDVCSSDLGGVYGVTKGLRDRFGAGRVFDTLLDETSILGLGLGAGLAGLLPIPEIQYLAYLHSAEDQLRGEAAAMSFFSQGAYRNPMVVRVAGLAYQEGFGGHFHNDNAVGVLRDIPGLVVACPSRPDDAAALLRTCLAAAVGDGTESVVLGPIAPLHTRDLHEPRSEERRVGEEGR